MLTAASCGGGDLEIVEIVRRRILTAPLPVVGSAISSRIGARDHGRWLGTGGDPPVVGGPSRGEHADPTTGSGAVR